MKVISTYQRTIIGIFGPRAEGRVNRDGVQAGRDFALRQNYRGAADVMRIPGPGGVAKIWISVTLNKA